MPIPAPLIILWNAVASLTAILVSVADIDAVNAVSETSDLAPSIINAAGKELRTDGIEARGLDENLELIVDRTPRRNYLAKSTPELIVRRLVERSDGEAKDVFKSILGRF